MADLILTTLEWVPEPPRGFVRDLRIRWALEEAGLPYRIATTPLDPKTEEHFHCQPFGQVPWLQDGDVTIFETGAILEYLGGKSDALLPADRTERDQARVWMFAALNSVEAASIPWSFYRFLEDTTDSPAHRLIDEFLAGRLKNLERVLTGREWLTERFTVADILMADVLRLVDRFDGLADYPACAAYLARATARPAFRKAFDDQVAFYDAADATRVETS